MAAKVPVPWQRGARSLGWLLAPLALAACADDPDTQLSHRGCLFVGTAAHRAEELLGRGVAVCGTIEPHDSVLWLSDGQRPRRAIALHFPTRTDDPGIARILERLTAWEEKRSRIPPQARFHGKLIHRPGYWPTLQVQRVDWLEGFGKG